MSPTPPGGGGALSYLSYTGMCRRKQGMAFRVFNRVYNFTIKRLEQGAVFLDWKPFKVCEDLR